METEVSHKTISVELKDRDHVTVDFEIIDNKIIDYKIKAVACTALNKELLLLEKLKGQNIKDIAYNLGDSHSSILVREILMKLKDEWIYPYSDVELCHCRKISTQDVDQAIISGCHRIEKIREMTWANTGCGTCLPDIQKMIKFRLNQK